MPDQETGLYNLQSRYYNPTIGRFINADAYVSTGQGILGNNMFAYCLNNPVNRTDETGSSSFWNILFANHDFGFIHRAVQAHIAFTCGAQAEIWILGGRADIKLGDAVWEVKHAGKVPANRICEAQTQAKRYIDGERITHLGPAGAFSGFFYIGCGNDSYRVEYTTPAQGAVLYTVSKVDNYQGEYFRFFQPHVQQNQHAQLSPASHNMSSFNINGIVHSSGGAGLLFVAYFAVTGIVDDQLMRIQ